MSQFPPIKISMLMDSGVQCEGEIFRKVLDVPVAGEFVQMWVKFVDGALQDRFIGDESIASFEFVHAVKTGNEPMLFQ
jgi:hypothetical protein